MDKPQFWRLIENAKTRSDGDCDKQAEILKHSLMRLSAEDIIAFDEMAAELCRAAYQWDLWGAASLISSGSDDGFLYFRCWLIAQGKAVFENALNDPDSLADVIEPDFADAECESLLYVSRDAYQEKTGQEMLADTDWESVSQEPAGTRWENETDVQRFLPRLTAKIAQSEPPDVEP